MKKALVTGGAGFIGSHVVEQLIERGYFVYILDNFRTGQEANIRRFAPGKFEVIRDSVLHARAHADSLLNVEVIFHLAAEVGNINSIERPGDDAATNILGTIEICELARQLRAKVVYSSSSAIYGESICLPIDESHPQRPLSPYGLSKLTGELYVRLFGELHGLHYVCLRYFNVYGEGQLFNPYSNVIPIFIRRALEEKPLIVYGDGGQTRDFVHVSDVALANVLAGESSVKDGVFNVGTGRQSSLQIILEILKNLRPTVSVEHRAPRAGEVRDSVASIVRIKQAIGFNPTIALDQGVRRCYEWIAASHPATG